MDRCVTMDGVQARLLALVAIGGAVGSVARYAVAGVVTRGDFPWGTFTVNLVGSFSLGLLFFLFLKTGYSSPELRKGVFLGFFGVFAAMHRGETSKDPNKQHRPQFGGRIPCL